ncbi:Methionine aminopeptidase 1A (MAP 1A) (MetAP 1A) (Peptidase M 1A), partial [Durusdinium trenchii]
MDQNDPMGLVEDFLEFAHIYKYDKDHKLFAQRFLGEPGGLVQSAQNPQQGAVLEHAPQLTMRLKVLAASYGSYARNYISGKGEIYGCHESLDCKSGTAMRAKVGIDQRNSQEETFPDQSKIIDLEETCRTKSIPVLEGIDLENMRQVCLQGREVLDLAARMLRPGITGDEIDRVVYIACRDRGLYPSPLNYMGFPKSICVSVNEVICHGIPDSRPLADGDLVNLDVSVCLEGFHADLNETYLVGHCDDESHRLVRSAYNALKAATALIRPGPGSTDGDRQE